MIESLIHQNEGKTLEFKRDTSSMQKILQTIVAFANTSGGTILIGVENEGHHIIGVQDALYEEERLSSTIADSIAPQILPRIEIHSYRKKELIAIQVSCNPGPYYLKKKGASQGVYVRLGSTNRIADPATLLELERIRMNVSFDELPCLIKQENDIDWDHLKRLFDHKRQKTINPYKRKNLGLLTPHMGKLYPSNAAVLMFGMNREDIFPDAILRCARFKGDDREMILDQIEFRDYLTDVVEFAVGFIKRHTKMGAKIGPVRRTNIPEYPHEAIREALQNAVLHTDYSITGCTIQVAIFETRIEITNPGSFVQGMTLELAKTGVSVLRNRIIGRVFKELGLIEQWGSGIKRMLNTCERAGLKSPCFEELNNQFRVTLYSHFHKASKKLEWEDVLVDYLKKHKTIQSKEAAKLWNVTDRGARKRLNSLLNKGVIVRIGVSNRDPLLCYALVAELN